jgi:hypothetical protein
MNFKEMSEEEKLTYLENKLLKQKDFLENVEGSGRSYSSSISISVTELEWLLNKAKN